MFSPAVQQAIEEELERGRQARADANEGRARVCARRAAGAAVREYLQRSAGPVMGSALDLLKLLQNVPDAPQRAKEAALNLVAKVDENHQLPGQADLLEEARILAQELEQLV